MKKIFLSKNIVNNNTFLFNKVKKINMKRNIIYFRYLI